MDSVMDIQNIFEMGPMDSLIKRGGSVQKHRLHLPK